MSAPLSSLLPAVIVDAEALLDSIVASLVAGVLITFTASMAIYGFATFAEMRRVGRVGGMLGAGAVAVVFTTAFVAAIVAGLYVMIKG